MIYLVIFIGFTGFRFSAPLPTEGFSIRDLNFSSSQLEFTCHSAFARKIFHISLLNSTFMCKIISHETSEQTKSIIPTKSEKSNERYFLCKMDQRYLDNGNLSTEFYICNPFYIRELENDENNPMKCKLLIVNCLDGNHRTKKISEVSTSITSIANSKYLQRRPRRIKRNVLLPSKPTTLRVVMLTDRDAQLDWHPPTTEHLIKAALVYRVEISHENSHRRVSVMTNETQISLADLQHDTAYNVTVYSRLASGGQESKDGQRLEFRTKPKLRRLAPVQNLIAKSMEFATLELSWDPPTLSQQDATESKIEYFVVMLYDLAKKRSVETSFPESEDRSLWITKRVPGGATVTKFLIRDLLPDSFYKIKIFAVSNSGQEGNPAIIGSSPRIISLPPTGPPKQVRLIQLGALSAAFKWKPPNESQRRGEIVAYQLTFNSSEWLAAKEVTVNEFPNYTITDLNPSTNYTLTVAAATRAGIGPKSPTLRFQTVSRKTFLDMEVMASNEAKSGETHSSVMDHSTPSSMRVQNVRYVAGERHILLLWSLSPMTEALFQKTPELSSLLPHYRTCTVRWGVMYPGPDAANVDCEKRAFSIENLEPETSYMISIEIATDNDEVHSEMTQANTRSLSDGKHSLIPINFRVISVGYNYAVLSWESPDCTSVHPDGSARKSTSSRTNQYPTSCDSVLLPVQYQIRYQLLDSHSFTEMSIADGFINCPTDTNMDYIEKDSSQTWIRIEQLAPGSRYVACVRTSTLTSALETKPAKEFGDWSFVQIFETKSIIESSLIGDTQHLRVNYGKDAVELSNLLYTNEHLLNQPNITMSSGQLLSSTFIGSNIWFAVLTILSAVVFLIMITIIITCLKRGSILVVRYKQDNGESNEGANNANVCLLTPAKHEQDLIKFCEQNGLERSLSKKQKHRSGKDRLSDFVKQNPEVSDTASATSQGRAPSDNMVGQFVEFNGTGSYTDAASRVAAGSSASSAISLNTPITNYTPGYFSNIPLSAYGYSDVEACRPLLIGQQNTSPYQMGLNRVSSCGPTTTVYPNQVGVLQYPVPMGNIVRSTLIPNSTQNRRSFNATSMTHGGPRIDLRAGENEDTYLQHSGPLTERGRIIMKSQCTKSSEIVSDSSTGTPAVFGPTSTECNASVDSGTANAYFGEFSPVSSVNSGSSQRYISPPPGGVMALSSTSKDTSPGNKQAAKTIQASKRGANRKYQRRPFTKRKTEAHTTPENTESEPLTAISTDELTQEMANLDGLMKDLSVITQNEFGC